MESATGYSYKLPERAFKSATAGVHQAKVFQAIYLGFQDGGKFKPGPKIGLNFLLDEGTTIFQKWNPSSHKRSNFGPIMDALFDKTHTEAELNGFDLGTVIGRGCTIKVVHKQTASGKTRAEIAAGAMPAIGNGVDLIIPDDFAFVVPGLEADLSKFPAFVQEMYAKQLSEADYLKKLAAWKVANPTAKEEADSALA